MRSDGYGDGPLEWCSLCEGFRPDMGCCCEEEEEEDVTDPRHYGTRDDRPGADTRKTDMLSGIELRGADADVEYTWSLSGGVEIHKVWVSEFSVMDQCTGRELEYLAEEIERIEKESM